MILIIVNNPKMKCSVIRNDNNEIVSVIAPNNNKSLLYDTLLQIFEDKEKALSEYSKIYTPNIRKYWIDPALNKIHQLLIGNNNISIPNIDLESTILKIAEQKDYDEISSVNELFYDINDDDVIYIITDQENNVISTVLNYNKLNDIKKAINEIENLREYKVNEFSIIENDLEAANTFDENGEPLLINGYYYFNGIPYKAYEFENDNIQIITKKQIKDVVYEDTINDEIKTLLDFLYFKTGIPYKVINDKLSFWKSRLNKDNVEFNYAYIEENTTNDYWHEYSHPILMYLRKNNNTAFYQLYLSLEKTPEFEEIKNRAKERIKSTYSNVKSIDDNIEELLAISIGYAAENKSKALSIRFRDFIKELLNQIKKLLGFDIVTYKSLDDLNETTTLKEFIDMYVDPHLKFVFSKDNLFDNKDVISEITESKDLSNYIEEIKEDIDDAFYENIPENEEDKQINEKLQSFVDTINTTENLEEKEILTESLLLSNEFNPENNFVLDADISYFLKKPKKEYRPRITAKKNPITNEKTYTSVLATEVKGAPIKITSKFIDILKKDLKGKTDITKPFTYKDLTEYEKEVLEEFRQNLIEKYVQKNQKKIQNKIILKIFKTFLEKTYPISYFESLEETGYKNENYTYNLYKTLTPVGKKNYVSGRDVLINNGLLHNKTHTFSFNQKLKNKEIRVLRNFNTLGWYIEAEFKDKILMYEYQSDIIDSDFDFVAQIEQKVNNYMQAYLKSLLKIGIYSTRLSFDYPIEYAYENLASIENLIKQKLIDIKIIKTELLEIKNYNNKIRKTELKDFNDFLTTITENQYSILRKIASTSDPILFEKNMRRFFKNRYQEISKLLITKIVPEVGTLENISNKELSMIKHVIYNYNNAFLKTKYHVNNKLSILFLELKKLKKEHSKQKRALKRVAYIKNNPLAQIEIDNHINLLEDRVRNYYNKIMNFYKNDIEKLKTVWFNKSLMISLINAKQKGYNTVYVNTPEFLEILGDSIKPYIDYEYFNKNQTDYITFVENEYYINPINSIEFIDDVINTLSDFVDNNDKYKVINTPDTFRNKKLVLAEKTNGNIYLHKVNLLEEYTDYEIFVFYDLLNLLINNGKNIYEIFDKSNYNVITLKDFLSSDDITKKVQDFLAKNIGNKHLLFDDQEASGKKRISDYILKINKILKEIKEEEESKRLFIIPIEFFLSLKDKVNVSSFYNTDHNIDRIKIKNELSKVKNENGFGSFIDFLSSVYDANINAIFIEQGFNKGGFIVALDKIKNISYKRVTIPEINTPVFEVDLSNFNTKELHRFSKIETYPENIKNIIKSVLNFYNLTSYFDIFLNDFHSLPIINSLAQQLTGYENQKQIIQKFTNMYILEDDNFVYTREDALDYVNFIKNSGGQIFSENNTLNNNCNG